MTKAEPEAAGGEILPDWSHYTLEELQEALDGLDRARYPEREAAILAMIQKRRHHPPRRSAPVPHYLQPPDWARYSLEELQQALDGLDRERYPEREAEIQRWLARRLGESGKDD